MLSGNVKVIHSTNPLQLTLFFLNILTVTPSKSSEKIVCALIAKETIAAITNSKVFFIMFNFSGEVHFNNQSQNRLNHISHIMTFLNDKDTANFKI